MSSGRSKAPLTSWIESSVSIGPSSPRRCAGSGVRGVGVEEAHDVRSGRVEPPPHRVPLAERGSVLGEHLIFLDHARPGARATSAVPSSEPASITTSSSTSPASASGGRSAAGRRRSSRRPPSPGSGPRPSGCPWRGGASRWGRNRPCSGGWPSQAATSRSTARPREARPTRRAEVSTRTARERTIGIPRAAQLGAEPLVLERLMRLQAADEPVGRRRDPQSTRPRSGDARVGVVAPDAREPLAAARRGEHGPQAAGRGRSSGASSTSPPIARAPAATASSWRASQSGVGPRVGVGGGDQTVGPAGGVQQLRPRPTCRAARRPDAGGRAVDVEHEAAASRRPRARRPRSRRGSGRAPARSRTRARQRLGGEARMQAPIAASSSRAGTTTTRSSSRQRHSAPSAISRLPRS